MGDGGNQPESNGKGFEGVLFVGSVRRHLVHVVRVTGCCCVHGKNGRFIYFDFFQRISNPMHSLATGPPTLNAHCGPKNVPWHEKCGQREPIQHKRFQGSGLGAWDLGWGLLFGVEGGGCRVHALQCMA